VLSYRRIRERAMDRGLFLPWLHCGNEVWSEALSVAMENARFEPSLEGEEIGEAIAEELLVLLREHSRSNEVADLLSGKAVVQGKKLLVRPTTLVEALQSRLVDDVVSQTTIREAAVSRLRMQVSRPRLGSGRLYAWAFPLPLPSPRVLGPTAVDRSMDAGPRPVSPVRRVAYELDRLDRVDRAKNEFALDPVHGRRVGGRNGNRNGEIRAGSHGSSENADGVPRTLGDANEG
jgi:hypothetical protein